MKSLTLICTGLVLAASAHATTSYTSFAAMQAANPSLAFIPVDFGSTDSQATSFAFEGGDLIFSSSLINGLRIVNNPGGTWGSAKMIEQNPSGGTISITLPENTVAFGMTLGPTAVGGTVTLAGNSGGAFSFDVSPSSTTSPLYLGVYSAAEFNTATLSINIGTARFGLTGFSYALAPEQAPEVAEPGTLMLIGSGLLMVPLFSRRLRRSATASER